MSRPDYNKCKQTANKILLEQEELPLTPNVFHMHSDKKIIISSIQDYCKMLHINIGTFTYGYKTLNGVKIYDRERDIYTILYNGYSNRLISVRWDISHELGHIFLEHKDESDVEETEANTFARQLLMPEYTVLRIWTDYKIVNTQAFSAIFDVSPTVASYLIQNLKKRGCIRVTSDDIEIWERQKGYVEERISYAERFYDLEAMF